MDCKIHGADVPTYGAKKLRCKKCNNEGVSEWRRRIKQKAVELGGGKCQACGYDKCIEALDFHHLDPDQKDFSITGSGSTRSWSRVEAEIKKCILLCANCHREIHALMRNSTASTEGQSMAIPTSDGICREGDGFAEKIPRIVGRIGGGSGDIQKDLNPISI